MVKILPQRPTRISAVATVLLITKTFTVKYYDRRIQTYREMKGGEGGGGKYRQANMCCGQQLTE